MLRTITQTNSTYVNYGPDIEAALDHLSAAIAQTPELGQTYPPRWLAIQLLEGDETLLAELAQTAGSSQVKAALSHSQNRLQAHYGDDIDVLLADRRYQFVHQLARSAVIRPHTSTLSLSDRVDKIVTHPWWGVPIFLALMWVVFKITTDLAAPYVAWVDSVISGPITHWAAALLELLGLSGTWLASLLLDGVIAGVGGVMVFVPVLMSLYLALALLEDSGYMARAAFVMDRLMQLLGLHGKSFIPLVVGFGCTVPAFSATRALENQRDRVLTGLLAPFMSCGARLPVYVLFATIFFPQHIGLVIFGLYLIGIVTAIGLGFILKKTVLKSREASPLLMELPAYRWPTWRALWFYVWNRTWGFIRNAWTTILAASIVIWALMAIPMDDGKFGQTDLPHSAFAVVAAAIAPVFEPLGFGSWQASGALVTGLVAKEVVISTIAQTYNLTEAESAAAPTTLVQDVVEIGQGFITATLEMLKAIPLIVGLNLFKEEETATPPALITAVQNSFEASSGGYAGLAGLAFLVFVLLYTPCIAALAAERRELGVRWMWLSVTGQLAVAWLMALLVFQGGKLLMALAG